MDQVASYPALSQVPVKADAILYEGAMVALLDADGYAVRAGTSSTGAVIGVSKVTVDATGKSDGDLSADIVHGLFYRENSDTNALVQADVGKLCYVEDDQTVADTGTIIAGLLLAVNENGALVYINPFESAVLDLAGPRIQKRTATIGFADLTTAGASQVLPIGAALPANARILGVALHTFTPFTGGTVSAMTIDIGSTGDADALIDGADAFTAAVDGQTSTRPLGIAPNKLFAASTQINATFTATGDTVDDTTAGAVTIDILYTCIA
jgi:hypothetical protein